MASKKPKRGRRNAVIPCGLVVDPCAKFDTAREQYVKEVSDSLLQQEFDLETSPPTARPPEGATADGAPSQPPLVIVPCLVVGNVANCLSRTFTKHTYLKNGYALLIVMFHPRAPHDKHAPLTRLQLGKIPPYYTKIVDITFDRNNGKLLPCGTNRAAIEEVSTYIALQQPVIPRPTLVSELIEDADEVSHGKSPSIHKLKLKSMAIKEDSSTRKCTLTGDYPEYPVEKTIMVVGATGAGKSTLIDGMVNYIAGVDYKDDARLKIIDMMEDEEKRAGNQALSQTDWITCYHIPKLPGSTVPYALNIIDTPGFGDTRGIQRDKELENQIREFFSSRDQFGVMVLDAVCVVVKAPDGRLTSVQKYIFNSIQSIFGKDIKDNIFILITFADGQVPPVLEALREAEVPFAKEYRFNNSALFENNTEGDNAQFSQIFWKIGASSFEAFFNGLGTVESRSLQLTTEVLKERQCLGTTMAGLQPQIDEGLVQVRNLEREELILRQRRDEITQNKDFKYEVEEERMKKIELPHGRYVTNCLNCNRTCHYPCAYANDADKIHCAAMSNGNCGVCPEHCSWDKHFNTPYRIEYENVKVEKTYEETKKKYETALGGEKEKRSIVDCIKGELKGVQTNVGNLISKMRNCIVRLNEIALKPNPLNDMDYIEMMIEGEKSEKKSGYLDRIRALENMKKDASIVSEVQNPDYNPISGMY